MSYTKRQLIMAAMSEVGLGINSFDISADQIEHALLRLDAMIAEWNGRGLRFSYPISSGPDEADEDAISNVPDWAWEAVVLNLAIRIAPSYGKMVGAETKASARHALNTVMARSAMPEEMHLGTLPVGAGAKSTDPFITSTDDGILAGLDAEIDL